MTAAADPDMARDSLLGAPLFDGLERARIVDILAHGQKETVGEGEYLCRQGEQARRFFLIAAGEIELTLALSGGGEHLVGHLRPGDHFGETALLNQQDSDLDARALTEVTILSYDRRTFLSLFLDHPVIPRHLATSLARQLHLCFCDHAETLSRSQDTIGLSPRHLDRSFLEGVLAQAATTTGADRGLRFVESTIARQIGKAVQRFSSDRHPILLSGETGTGRRMMAAEIHHHSPNKNGPYREIDVRASDPARLEEQLFGGSQETFSASPPVARSLLNKLQGGTLTLYNAEYLEPDCQRQLIDYLKKSANTPEKRCRLILICSDRPEGQDGHQRLLPTLYTLLSGHHFRAAPLRDHRRDIPRLIHYYLRRYSQQYGKHINSVDDQTLGRFINYHWPGNLAELSGVLQRAVLLGENHQPLNPQIILGLPKVEGKWEFNLLQLPRLRAFLASRLFPLVPRIVVGLIFLLVVIALLAGPERAEDNIGLTLSWIVGWPLLVFSFFFLARTWCSVCGLAAPGWLAQLVLKPKRPTPAWIRRHSGWIMAFLCVLLFWIETTWNAYHSPQLTAWIILSITLGSLLFSVFYQRRVWCRYLCPLGAINALFSMPAVVELRANSQMCANRCANHLCYHGNQEQPGCPMFRHPFLVDNNRDCILCGQCIKTCRYDSLHLNLRLAPQELWNQQAPRLADSVLVVCLAAIVFPFVLAQHDPGFLPRLTSFAGRWGWPDSLPLTSAALFLTLILLYLGGYLSVTAICARIGGSKRQMVTALLGYGMIPLVLGTYMAAHLAILVEGLWLLPTHLLSFAGIDADSLAGRRLLSPDTTYALQFLSVFGGLLASLYATHRIVRRLAGRHRPPLAFLLPALLLCLSAVAYLAIL